MKKINFDLNDIKGYASSNKTYTRGLEYYKNNHILKIEIKKIYNEVIEENVNIYESLVSGSNNSKYNTYVTIDDDGDIYDYDCNCNAFYEYPDCCKHIIALMIKIYNTNNKNQVSFSDYVARFNVTKNAAPNYALEDLIKIYENKITEVIKKEKTTEGKINLKPILFISAKDSLNLEFTIGEKRGYVVKDAYELAQNIKNNKLVYYGKSLEFNHDINGFDKESQPLAIFLRDEADAYKQVIAKTQGQYSTYGISDRYFKIMPFSIDNLFDIFENKTIECHGYNYKYNKITFINQDPEAEFYIKSENGKKYITTNLYISLITSSKKYTYLVVNDKLYRCTKNYINTVLPAVNKIMSQPMKSIPLSDEYMGKFCSAVLPQLSKSAKIISDIELEEKYKIHPLLSSIYLDTNNQGNIYASVIFNYGEVEINPFRKSPSDNSIGRNLIEEAKIITALENVGFTKSTAKFTMTDEDKVYEFLTSGINNIMPICEVNVSDDFKKINIRYPKSMTMGIRLKSNLIEIDIDKLEFDPAELKDILDTYKKRKKYFRLKDGSYLNLDNDYFSTMEKLVEDLDITREDLEKGLIEIPKYRSLYLDSLVKNNTWINTQKEFSFKEMIRNIKESDESDFKIPQNLEKIMRNYQKSGFKWLKTMSMYSLGGILADDMGLGKTLQVISLLLSEKYEDNKKPSIVICPTSLVYNWKNEIEKFAPEISALIVNGTVSQRQELIKSAHNYDLIFTSYDLLKRDVEYYDDLEFKYCILDEAQYIKNASTQNAKTVKFIKSDVRFALTGTPIENSLSDLWSIFDFILPGFFLSYNKFKDKYEVPIVRDEDKDTLKRLQKQIQPFILRRLKKDVLKELPDKIETVSYAQMDNTQKKIYTAELYKLSEEFKKEVDEQGYDKSQIKILSMLTRLRQICCHPSLFYDNYKGGSAKLDLCMELILSSIENGHKILIFSQFTSMLALIEKNLKSSLIDYYKLTGTTKSQERLDMANKFNTDNTPVFLISLKAGGTGLNLTGADVVIHFDPWWNISAQNQATDRTHRIGQENKVQVFKLITKDTIEEKIEKLQQSKKDLADAVIKKGEVIINTLSKEEIQSLFEV